ncbi:MAG: glycosyltransferase family 4 protein [Chloroflexota bacterium]
MRIVHVIDYFQPRLGYQETFLAREHARLGHDVCVITSDRYNPVVYSGNAAGPMLGKRIVGAGSSVEEGIKVWRLRALFEVPHAIWLRGLEDKIRELGPEMVIVHGVVNFSAIRIARMRRGGGAFKLVYDDHMTFANSLSPMRALYPLFRLAFSPSVQQAADALVAILPESRQFMHVRYGIPLERIAVIPLGADDELFRFDADARREVRRQLGLDDDDVVFVYAGKIIPDKRLGLLVEAVASLVSDGDKVKVMIAGSGAAPYMAELKQAIKARGLGGRFVWHGAVPNEQLYRIYSAADAAVWPYGASIGQREAMACGLPLVISEDSGVTELVENDNGLLFRDGDAGDLARQMGRLLDTGLRQEMGRRSRRLVADRFSWRVIARQFLELIPLR